MRILLDFDGVLITTPSWQKVPVLDDGFMAFNNSCACNVAQLVDAFSAQIVLTTTHRIHYDNDTWKRLLANRGIKTSRVSKSNGAKTYTDLDVRCKEIIHWVARNPSESFIILDDDQSLSQLPEHIKGRWIKTSFMLGFTDTLKDAALRLMP